MIGQLFGGLYRPFERLEDDGDSAVYLARDARDRRVVVLRTPTDAAAADPARVAAFVERAGRLRQAANPRLVRVLDQGLERGTGYAVEEPGAGALLADDLASRAPLTPEDAVQLFGQVFEGLAA